MTPSQPVRALTLCAWQDSCENAVLQSLVWPHTGENSWPYAFKSDCCSARWSGRLRTGERKLPTFQPQWLATTHATIPKANFMETREKQNRACVGFPCARMPSWAPKLKLKLKLNSIQTRAKTTRVKNCCCINLPYMCLQYIYITLRTEIKVALCDSRYVCDTLYNLQR